MFASQTSTLKMTPDSHRVNHQDSKDTNLPTGRVEKLRFSLCVLCAFVVSIKKIICLQMVFNSLH